VGAHVAREGFQEYTRYLDNASKQAAKGVHARLSGDLIKDGFERFGRSLRQAQAEAKETTAGIDKSLATVNEALAKADQQSVKSLTVIRDQLKATRDSYVSHASAVEDSIKAEERAMVKRVRAAAEAGKAERNELAKTMSVQDAKYGGGGGGGGKVSHAAIEDAGGKAANSWKKGFEKSANVGKWSIIGALGIGVLSVKAAADFEKQMELVHTQAGYTQKQVESLGKSVKDLAPAVGVGPTKLAEGLFHLASAGIPASKAMEVLAKAAELAKVGNSGMDETTYALVSLLKTAPKDIHNTAEAVGVMNEIVGKGDLHMKDLVKALSSGVVPAGKAVGLGLRDVGAALDVLTSRGTPAEEAATRLRTSLGLVANPTAKAQKALETLGIQSDSLAKQFREHGLAGALEYLQDHLDKTFPKGRALNVEETKAALGNYKKSLEEAGVTGAAEGKALEKFHKELEKTGEGAIQQSKLIAEAFGGARIGTTWQILMQNIDDVRKHTEDLNKPDEAQRFQKDWEDTQKTFSAQMSKMWAGVQKLGIEVGEFLIPKLVEFGKAVVKVSEYLGQHKVILKDLIILLGGALTAAVAAFFIKWGISIGNTFKQFGDLIKRITGMPAATKGSSDAMIIQAKAQQEAVEGINKALIEQERLQSSVGGRVIRDPATGKFMSSARTEEAVAGNVQFRGKSGQFMSKEASSVYAKNALGIAGARGAEQVFSAANPGVVVMEDANQAGLGSKAAAIGSNAPVAGAENAAASKAGAAGGAKGKIAGAKESISSGTSALKTGVSSLMGNLMKAGMIAGFGTIAAEMAGSAIGGSTGKTVASAGKDAALGAAFGSMFGPEGTIAGGVLGGLVGGFKLFDSETQGQKLAKSVAKGMAPGVSKGLEEGIDKANKRAEESTAKAEARIRSKEKQEPGTVGTPPHGGPSIGGPKLSAAEQKKIDEQRNAEFAKTGAKLGTSIVSEQLTQTIGKGMGPEQAITSIIEFMKKRLSDKGLPEAARAAAGHTIIELVKGMEEKKELPKKSVQEVIQALGAQFPKLKKYAEETGKESMQALAASQEGKEVLKKAETFINNLRNVYRGFEKFPALTSENALSLFQKANAKLEHEEKTGNANKRIAAKEDREQLKKQEEQWYSDREKNIDDRLKNLNSDGHKKTQKGNEEIALLYEARSNIIGEKLQAGVTSSKTAAKELNENFLKELKELGVSPAELKKTEKGLRNVGTEVGKGLHNLLGGKAHGGVASPHGGSSSDDHILLDPHGKPVAAMSGTEGIINRPQMDVINQALGTTKALGAGSFGSLPELWNSGMRHYATGGSLSHYDRLVQAANKVSSRNFPYHWGGGHEQPAHFEPFDCSGAVSYIVQQAGYRVPTEVSGSMTKWSFPQGPGDATVFYNADHTFMRIGNRYWGTSGFARPKGGAGWFEEAPDSSYLKGFNTIHLPELGKDSVAPGGVGGFDPLKEPAWKGPGGTIGAIGKAITKKTTAAANSALAKIAGRIDGGGEGGTAGGGQHLKDGSVAGPVVTASNFGGHNDPSAFNHPTASGKIANDSLMGFAELSNPPGSLNFSALGNLPISTLIEVGYKGHKITIPKVDVGAGGPGLDGHVRAIDLTYAANKALGAPGLENVHWRRLALGGLLGFARGGTPSIGEHNTGPQKTIGIGHHRRNPTKRIEKKLHPTVTKGKKQGKATKPPKHSSVHRKGSNPKGAGKKKQQKFKKGKPGPVEEYTGLPESVINADAEIERQQEAIAGLDTEYNYATEEDALPPTPEAVVTLSEADVAAIDPKGTTNAKGEFVPGPTGYEPGDQIVNPDGMTVGRYFGPNETILGGSYVPGINTRMAQIAGLLGILGQTGSAYGIERGQNEFLIGGPNPQKIMGRAGDIVGHISEQPGAGFVKIAPGNLEQLVVHTGLDYTEAKKREEDIKKYEGRTKRTKERYKRLEAFKKKHEERIKKIREKLRALTSGNLQANLKKALSKQEIDSRKNELKGALSDIGQELTAEKAYQASLLEPREKSKGHEDYLKSQRDAIKGALEQENSLGTGISAKASVSKAQEAIVKNNLKNEVAVLEEMDKHLGDEIKVDKSNVGTYEKREKTLFTQKENLEKDAESHVSDVKELPGLIHTLDTSINQLHTEESELAKATNIQPRPRKEPKKEAEEAARKAVEDLGALDAASQALFQQFGSNTLSSAALPAALAGGISQGGMKFFGAAGGTSAPHFASGGPLAAMPAPAPMTTENKSFHQTNHYSVGPQNPHIHAQESAAEFAARMG
jgi:TP901 family phage tail tape measure protein